MLAFFLAIGSLTSCSHSDEKLPENTLIVHRDLSYTKVVDNTRLLDLYLPKNHQALIPVLLWVHGGGWTVGDKADVRMLHLIDLGYAVASINYRFSQEAVFPAQIYDCKAAVRWLRANAATYHLNPDKVGAGGDSAGGHLVALLGTTANDPQLEGQEGNPGVSSAVQAVCDFYGPTDLVSVEGQCTGQQLAVVKPLLEQLLGGTVTAQAELARLGSPILHVSSYSCPFFIVHGDHDEIVPIQQSIDLNNALKKAGVDSTLYVIKGGIHGNMDAASVDGAIKFIQRQLGS